MSSIKPLNLKTLGLSSALLLPLFANAQNPIITGQFTADPTARLFGDTVYLYPSHDIPSPIEELKEWFCMEDYHVFSSQNLVDWVDHGVIVSQNAVPWVKPDSYAMWAPDCVEKDGLYYFYFPAAPAGIERGFGVGVAIASSPAGPFTPMLEPIKGLMGIDPCVLVDDDGQAYMVWAGMGIRGVKLKDNMMELDGEPKLMEGLPDGFKEGPFIFKRAGKYYLTFPWVRQEGGTETLAYAMSDSPLGPWDFKGIIMAESPTGCWTNHHSIIEKDGQWLLFYHHNDYSPEIDKRRSARIDYLNFNADGTIQEVVPTLRGVGAVPADVLIQIDRYSGISGASVDYLDPADPFKGWKTCFAKPGQWVRFDNVDFSATAPHAAIVKAKGGKKPVKLRVVRDSLSGPVLAVFDIEPNSEWAEVKVPSAMADGNHDIFVIMDAGAGVEVDYLRFDGKAPWVESAGDAGAYFNAPAGASAAPDSNGFIRRWHILEPIDKPNRTNTVFTDSYLREAFGHPYFEGQFEMVPADGQKVKVDGKKLQWHWLESTGYNNQLFRFSSTNGKQVYGVIFWVVTVIDAPEDIENVRLSVGSNSASMWWLNGEEALLMSGDRRMVVDDAASQRLTLKKGKNVLRGAIINGPGMSNFCVRFVNEDGGPIVNYNIVEN